MSLPTHMRNADSPVANAPHLIRKLKFHHVLLDGGQIVIQIAVILIERKQITIAGLTVCHLCFNILKPPHPLRVHQAGKRALSAAGRLLIGPVSLARNEPHDQLLLHLFNLLHLSFFGLHLVHKLGPSFPQPVALNSESVTQSSLAKAFTQLKL